MKTKYAIVNTMSDSSDCKGQVLSLHLTEHAAEVRDQSIQRRVKRANGLSSYLPTIVCEVPWGTRKGWLSRRDVIA